MKTSVLTRIGCIFLIIWGLLHFMAGANAIYLFMSGGAFHLLDSFGYPVSGTDSEALIKHVGHLSLVYSLYVAIIGFIGIWAAVHVWKSANIMAFRYTAAFGGLTDLAFIIVIVVPGYLPWSFGLQWIVTYVVALFCIRSGLRSE